MSGDMMNFTSFHMTAGGSPMSIGLPDGVCTVTVKAIQGYVGLSQEGAGSWTPEKVASMSGDNDYAGATIAEGDTVTFKARSIMSTSQTLYLASLEATNPSIASVFILPE